MDNLPVVREKLPLRPGKFATTPLKKLPQHDSSLQVTNQADQPLTRKQTLAVEYLVSGRARSQYRACLDAGYAESTAAAAAGEVFSKPNVRRYYQKRRRELFAGEELTSKQIIEELLNLADASLADYGEVKTDSSGRKVFKVEQL